MEGTRGGSGNKEVRCKQRGVQIWNKSEWNNGERTMGAEGMGTGGGS